jgi:ferric-chelate reductase (NADPH)
MGVSGQQEIGNSPESSQPASHSRSPGLIERAITRMLMRPARVTATTVISENFRLLDFQGEALRNCVWSPGDKIQIKLDGGFITRTYTPIEWNKTQGATQVLAYCHGDGPGSVWARNVPVNDLRQIFGPRGSLDLKSLAHSIVVFGDETSFGLAAALRRKLSMSDGLHFVFEVNRLAESRQTVETVGVTPEELIERAPGDSHLAAIAEAVRRRATDATTFVLTGKAATIQYLSRVLKGQGVETRRLRNRAYWAPGKIGLD